MRFSLSAIAKFAQSIGRDSGIVLGRLQNDGFVRYEDASLARLRTKHLMRRRWDASKSPVVAFALATTGGCVSGGWLNEPPIDIDMAFDVDWFGFKLWSIVRSAGRCGII